ncbi:hypothetical protein [Chryseobacterium chendengshani]|uniref:hypothetical protein n=1 Tax=Chryseobacterium sp. LJ756 TaxID=2864113 RepID=UPI001C63ED21|nr:hypothetical protein [Chryseobacterium sp. LJ756]MBW7675668.1 hypothetical protein [Chryseobacterium sp. LJ756]
MSNLISLSTYTLKNVFKKIVGESKIQELKYICVSVAGDSSLLNHLQNDHGIVTINGINKRIHSIRRRPQEYQLFSGNKFRTLLEIKKSSILIFCHSANGISTAEMLNSPYTGELSIIYMSENKQSLRIAIFQLNSGDISDTIYKFLSEGFADEVRKLSRSATPFWKIKHKKIGQGGI